MFEYTIFAIYKFLIYIIYKYDIKRTTQRIPEINCSEATG